MKKVIYTLLCFLLAFTAYAAETNQRLASPSSTQAATARQTASSQDNPQTESPGVTLRREAPEQQSVLAQASSPDIVTDLSTEQFRIGTRKASLRIFGQINFLGFWADDGQQKRVYFGTNANSNSRLNINSIFRPDERVSIGSRLQLGFNIDDSSKISQPIPNPSDNIDIRRAEMFIETIGGTITFGKGETASDNTALVDLSGTKIVSRSAVADVGGGLFFRDKEEPQALTGTQIADVTNNLDGFARRTRLMYETPTWHGLLLATSAIERGGHDAALKYGDTLGTTKLAAEIAYSTSHSVGNPRRTVVYGPELDGSASVLFHCGLNFTASSGELSPRHQPWRLKPYYYYGKAGYQQHFTSIGLTAISAQYGQFFNEAQNHDVSTFMGVSFVQNINPLDLAVYASYQQYQLARPGSSLHYINLFVFGAIYQF